MGCRIYHAKKYQVEWDTARGGYFNWKAEELEMALRDLGIEVWMSNPEDSYGDWEISKDELSKLVKILQSKDPDELIGGTEAEPIDAGTTLEWARTALENSDPNIDYVRFSWF